ncbi:Transmembrane GTPase Marf [Operophtera brumata]|uniref:Transmembrane GTPase Marf n=1 Tax=Operophtera brumata TaxID=104452 RepID=A0A0L7KEV9_OPEBR|nr:Transmembrane GTPase Marf [Operophtera brumata]
MAAYVNRTISMMAGDGPHNVGTLNNGVRVNMANVDSPLQIFVRAKKKINDIFVEIDDYPCPARMASCQRRTWKTWRATCPRCRLYGRCSSETT